MPNRRTLHAWLWTFLVVVLCLLPRHLTPERRSMPRAMHLRHLDKIVHFAMFAGFGWLWVRSVGSGRRGWMIVLIGAMLAVGTELAQGLEVVDRDPDVLDAIADLMGLASGVASYRVAPRVLTVWQRPD